MLAIVKQRLRQQADKFFVFREQLNMPLPHWGIDRISIAVCCDEEILDHAVWAQQIESIQKQLGIRRNALANGGRQFEPSLSSCAFISFKQRHETLNQHCEIQSIGLASTQDNAVFIK